MNILYIHSHDTGRYVQPYGHAIPTPNIQKLANQGVLFRQAFCTNPTCSPSRSSLLTGQWPHTNGMIGLAHRGFSLNDPSHHLAHTLRRAGYATAVAGQQHVARYVNGREQLNELGYDHILTDSEASSTLVTERALQFIRENRHPFFLSVGYFETHRPFPPQPADQDDPRYTAPPAPLPDTPEIRGDMAAFKTSARQLDDHIGQILASLDDNTLVICTTDHGIAFPKMKCHLTDHGIGVMLILRGPADFTGGKTIDAMVSQIDIFPTICQLLNLAPPWLQGDSLLPLIRGQRAQIHDAICAELSFHAAYEPARCVRTTRWKYIRRFELHPHPILPNCDDSPSKDELLRNGWKDQPLFEESLYDLALDPNEANNLADQPEMNRVLDNMRQRLNQWMHQTDDPLLRGPLAIPIGARVNRVDQLSPSDPI